MNQQNNGLKLEECLPTCVDIEKALLGRLMTTNSLYSKVTPALKQEHFTSEEHQVIFGALGQMIAMGQAADPLTLLPYLVSDEESRLRVMRYLGDMVGEACSNQSVGGYAAQVIEYHARRAMVRQCFAQIKKAMTPELGVGLSDLLNDHDNRIQILRPEIGGKRGGFMPMSKLARETALRIQGEWNGSIKRHTMSTGFPSLDDEMGGLEATDLITIGGRPGSGKTSLGLDILFNAAREIMEKETGGVVAAFSIEMSESQLVERMMSRISGVTGTRIRRRSFDKFDMERLFEAAAELEKMGIEIDPEGAPGIAQITARARDLHRRKGLRLLLIDFLQLIKPFKENNRRDLEISEITAALKALAKEIGCPIILLSQVKREVDDRDNKIPKASDVAEGGTTEQNSDTMLMIHRKESYLIQNKPSPDSERFLAWEKEMRACRGIADVFIAKSRHGGQDVLRMGYDGPRTTFLDRPIPREPEPIEARQQEKKDTVSQLARDLRSVIQSLVFAEGRKPTQEQREFDRSLPAGATMVPREQVKAEFAAKIRPDDNEAELKKAMNSASSNLRSNKLTGYFRDKDGTDYVYLVGQIAE